MTRALTLASLLLLSVPAYALEPGCYVNLPMEVVDGDTVRIESGTVRLGGYDTPETHRPECEEERAWGQRATDRLTELLASHATELCITNAECNWGRPCGHLSVRMDGYLIDVGAILVSEDLAIPFVGSMGDWCE